MAHIAACMAGGASSPSLSSRSPTPSGGQTSQSYTLRMQQTPELQPKRYQLFPRETPLPVLNNTKALDPGAAYAVAMSQKSSHTPASRVGANSPSFMKRRKGSADLPPLPPIPKVTQVKGMDSPTIPGRLPIHERSNSAPGERKENSRPYNTPRSQTPLIESEPVTQPMAKKRSPSTSPKRLAPIVIPEPTSNSRKLVSKRSSMVQKQDEGSRSNSSGEASGTRSPPALSSAVTDSTPKSTTRTTPWASKPLPTPVSAPAGQSQWSSAKAWEEASSAAFPPRTSSNIYGHRRGNSEVVNIMDRGRPPKRSESRGRVGLGISKPAATEEEPVKAAELDKLPSGSRPKQAMVNMEVQQLSALQSQAIEQAKRFEVLKAEDVTALSQELRLLDERTKYLRQTYNSIRAGRRDLHERICEFHRIAKVAKYSCDTMLKQQEALSELDGCIDEWVTKLERAEDRRTLIRQKLLEHVAAAAILPLAEASTPGRDKNHQIMDSPMGPQFHGIFTPPRSPSRNGSPDNSPSPQRIVAQVPSTILEHPVVEEEEAAEEEASPKPDRPTTVSTVANRDEVQSIRVYAGDDIYTLLADVENEMSKMRCSVDEAIREALPHRESSMYLERDRSAELLSGQTEVTVSDWSRRRSFSSPYPGSQSPPAPPPPIKDFPMKPKHGRAPSAAV